MASSQSTIVGTGNPVLKWVLRLLVVGYLFFLVAWPTSRRPPPRWVPTD